MTFAISSSLETYFSLLQNDYHPLNFYDYFLLSAMEFFNVTHMLNKI